MSCGEIRELLSAHLDGELEEADRRRVEGHLSGCKTCAGELEGLRRAAGLLRALPRETAPAALAVLIHDSLPPDDAPEPVGRISLPTPGPMPALRLRNRILTFPRAAAAVAAGLLVGMALSVAFLTPDRHRAARTPEELAGKDGNMTVAKTNRPREETSLKETDAAVKQEEIEANALADREALRRKSASESERGRRSLLAKGHEDGAKGKAAPTVAVPERPAEFRKGDASKDEKDRELAREAPAKKPLGAAVPADAAPPPAPPMATPRVLRPASPPPPPATPAPSPSTVPVKPSQPGLSTDTMKSERAPAPPAPDMAQANEAVETEPVAPKLGARGLASKAAGPAAEHPSPLKPREVETAPPVQVAQAKQIDRPPSSRIAEPPLPEARGSAAAPAPALKARGEGEGAAQTAGIAQRQVEPGSGRGGGAAEPERRPVVLTLRSADPARQAAMLDGWAYARADLRNAARGPAAGGTDAEGRDKLEEPRAAQAVERPESREGLLPITRVYDLPPADAARLLDRLAEEAKRKGLQVQIDAQGTNALYLTTVPDVTVQAAIGRLALQAQANAPALAYAAEKKAAAENRYREAANEERANRADRAGARQEAPTTADAPMRDAFARRAPTAAPSANGKAPGPAPAASAALPPAVPAGEPARQQQQPKPQTAASAGEAADLYKSAESAKASKALDAKPAPGLVRLVIRLLPQ
jgi:hypothetical protein